MPLAANNIGIISAYGSIIRAPVRRPAPIGFSKSGSISRKSRSLDACSMCIYTGG